ncbi:MAG: hypothetical protein HQK84_11230, partial [Nitrospinae bacterium]|nr:hypothetical protein [Nitrospinota bacterium]
NLPKNLRNEFGDDSVKEIDLSRWISLSDGVSLDDVSFAMQRALRLQFPELLKDGFNVVIHSTGALVVRNWIRKFSPKPSPINNLVYLAGANFGSGLAHIGKGQLSRWGRLIFNGTGCGTKILNELEFGSWKTIDLQRSFLHEESDMYYKYKVQEFCMNGSQTLPALRLIPIRYIKEDSADNTVRTSSCNLNFNYISVIPTTMAHQVSKKAIAEFMEQRLDNKKVEHEHYEFDLSCLAENREPVPFAVLYETAHFGEDIGIVDGKDNRNEVIPLVVKALKTPSAIEDYRKTAQEFTQVTAFTFERVSKLTSTILEWDKQAQYEGHAQLIFRLQDQFGNPVEDFDIMINSGEKKEGFYLLENLVEDKHNNDHDKGSITFYLRTQKFENNTWKELLENVMPTNLEITGHEASSDDINYLPLTISLTPEQIRKVIQSFRTTIFDITLLRLPSEKVFSITKSP